MKSFYIDTIKLDARFQEKKRVSSLDLLEPVMRAAVGRVIADAKAHGLELMVFETYRSPARQELLFEQGATKLRKVGVHHYGLAADIVKSVDGDPSWKGDFTLLGELARQHGLIWGGDWKSFKDLVHVQRCTIAKQSLLFRNEWYPDEDYDPYDE